MKDKLFLGILAACLFVLILFSFLFTSFLGSVVSSTKCVDSDGGINQYVKGSVSTCADDTCSFKGEDVCDANYVVEYYCTNFGKVANSLSKCTFGCYDGECLHIGEKPKLKEADENISDTDEATEEIGKKTKEIVCDEEWMCEDSTRGFQQADCTWIKEKYCKYGCTAGECEMPGWWGRFVFWLKGVFS